MSSSDPRGVYRVTATAALLFTASALILGALGSAQLWQQGIAQTTVPYSRMAVVVIAAEILAYLAVLLAGPAAGINSRMVMLRTLLGVLLRATQASVAALVSAPEQAASFPAGFLHYYAEYLPGVVVQIGSVALLLWLLKGTARTARSVLRPAATPADGDRPVVEPTRERRFELIQELMRREGESSEAQHAEERTEAPTAPDEPEPIEEPTPPEPVVAPIKNAPVLEPPVPAPPVAEPPVIHAPPPEPVASPEAEPETVAPEKDEPVHVPPRSPLSVIEPVGGSGLTSRESILDALDDGPRTPPSQPDAAPLVPQVIPLPRPAPQVQARLDLGEELDEPGPGPVHDVPAPVPEPEPSRPTAHGMFTVTVGLPPPEETPAAPTVPDIPVAPRPALAALLPDLALRLGCAGVELLTPPQGACVALLNPPRDLARATALAAQLFAESAELATACGEGAFTCCVITGGGAELALGEVRDGGEGAVLLVSSPAGAVRRATELLARGVELVAETRLPAWRSAEVPEMMPAFPDDDLRARLADALAALTASGTEPVQAFYAGGRQVVTIGCGADQAATSAALAAHAFGAVEELLACYRMIGADTVTWLGASGALSCAPVVLKGQRVLVCRVTHGQIDPPQAAARIAEIVARLTAPEPEPDA